MAVQRAAPKIAPKPEDGWHQARLIPTTSGHRRTGRAGAAGFVVPVLAVMRAVPQFGRAILAHLDAPAGRINTFTRGPLPRRRRENVQSPTARSSSNAARHAGYASLS